LIREDSESAIKTDVTAEEEKETFLK
jgi:5'-3' exonuclease